MIRTRGRTKPSLEDYYKAGAWFRLMKTMLCDFEMIVPRLLGLYAKDTDMMGRINKRFSDLEVKCGFEHYLENDYGKELDNPNFCDMFYGDLSSNLGRDTLTEREVRKQALLILDEISENIKKSLE